MNSCQKGKRGELEWSKFLNERFGLSSRRGRQYSGSPDSPDVVGGWPGTHAEVKRVQSLNIHAAVDQAKSDSSPEDVPYVAHRKNGQPWLITILATDVERFAACVTSTRSIPPEFCKHRLDDGAKNCMYCGENSYNIIAESVFEESDNGA